jgi:hypothetical protein
MKLLPKLAAIAAALVASTALAADHRDGDAVQTDPSTDINDVYTFTNGNNVVLAMTVSPFAATGAKFSDVAQYVFHVESYDKFGGAKSGSTDVICTFATDQKIQCWVGNKDYVTGDASAAAGITSTTGKTKVFAGLRADPFYFYLTGFKNTRSAALAAAGTLMFNPNNCPQLNAATVTALQGLLITNDQTKNDFAMANVLGLTLEVDKSLLIANPDEVISVWASTNK